VSRVLLEQMEQYPLQGGRVRAVPAGTGLAGLGQVVGLDDGTGASGLVEQVGQEADQGVVRADVPAAVLVVAPRVGNGAALEAPLEPAQLDPAQVVDQLERRPAGRQPGAVQLGGGQRPELVGQPGPEVVQVAEEDLGARAGRGGRLGERYGDGGPFGVVIPRWGYRATGRRSGSGCCRWPGLARHRRCRCTAGARRRSPGACRRSW
jgi:hypothetical protein